MNLSKGQGELFNQKDYFDYSISVDKRLSFKKEEIEAWQMRIHTYQALHFKNVAGSEHQNSFFDINDANEDSLIPDILNLTPLPLNFWQWPKGHHDGPAIYLVMDKLTKFNSHILLYIGETIAAEKRWKGEHDCKSYLQEYSEACQKVGLTNQLSIRFWKDVPKNTKFRRELEKQLIKKWLPAFNKETRGTWNTPFTNEIKQ